MRVKVILMAMAAATLAVPSAMVVAQSGAQTKMETDPRYFDIAGVKIGMAPATVRAELTKRGFKVGADNTDTMGYSYQLESRLQQRNPNHPYGASKSRVRSMSGRGPANEFVMVSFIDMPEGARAYEISYSLDAEKTQTKSMRDEVMQKFGQPTVARDSLGSAFWCRRSELKCARVGHSDTMLEFSDVYGITLRLTDGPRLEAERDAIIAAEVDRMYPKQRPSF